MHYSDIHVDQQYVAGAANNCTKPICCRSYTPADAPGNNGSPAGPNGDHNCDAPVSLEESMYAAIKATAPNAVFSVFTGDIVDHAVWETTEASVSFDITDAYSRMGQIGNNIYGTIGNHETSPINAFQTLKEGNSASWVYGLVSQDWMPWIGASSSSSVQSFGAYSVGVPNHNMKVISINTNLYHSQNYWLYEEPMETRSQRPVGMACGRAQRG